MRNLSIQLTAVPHIPQVQPGDNVAELIVHALEAASISLQTGDILAIAQKIISKAEGRLVNLSDVTPSERAHTVAAEVDKDPRLVELILQESQEISRMKRGALIVRHRLGFTSANAGIDRSNVQQTGAEETVLLLPLDPDRSAGQIQRHIKAALGVDVGVVISDTHGRPFRLGNAGIAIGVAGIPALWDRRGEPDLYGYTLQHTDMGVADEIAAAADLLMGAGAEGLPVILLRGLTLPQADGRATDLVRSKELDLYK